jgi:hypothetical protein
MHTKRLVTTLLVVGALAGCTTLAGLDHEYMPICDQGSARSCYSGPAATKDIGLCKTGLQLCNPEGSGYGDCIGEVLPRIERCDTPIEDENCDSQIACVGNTLWSKSFGGTEYVDGRSVATNAAGDVLIAGNFAGSLSFGGETFYSAGHSDIFIAQFTSDGDHVWSKSFGDAENQDVSEITVDHDGNIVLKGSFLGTLDFGGGPMISMGAPDSYDEYVVKLTSKGDYLWSKRFPGANLPSSVHMAVDRGGNVLCTGNFAGSLDVGGGALTSAGLANFFIVKYDSSGAHVWSRSFSNTDYLHAAGIASDHSGNVLLAGAFSGNPDSGGLKLAGAGGIDAFIAKFDPSGAHVWSKGFGDPAFQSGDGVASDSADNVLFTGTLVGTVDFGGGPLTSGGESDQFVVKLSPSGDHIWSKGFGGPDASIIFVGGDFKADNADNVLLSAHFAGSTDFGGGTLTTQSYDLFALKLTPAGGHLWSRHFGNEEHDNFLRMTNDKAGNVFLTGQFQGSVDFGTGALTSVGIIDIFLAKLAP